MRTTQMTMFNEPEKTMKTRMPTVPKLKKPIAAQAPATDIPLLTGYEDFVDTLFNLDVMAKETLERLKANRTVVDAAATLFRTANEIRGNYSKIVHIKGTEHNGVYNFKDAYSPIDISKEGEMRSLLGNVFDKLFRKKKQISIKAGCEQQLLDLAKKHGFESLIVSKEVINPVDSFRESRFLKRGELSAEQNAALDSVVEQTGAQPTLTFK